MKRRTSIYRPVSPAQQRANDHYYRARTMGSDTDYSAAAWAALVDWFGGACLACGADKPTVDHVVPLSRGGCNTLRNLQPLCCPCNSRKHDRTIDYRDPIRLVQLLEMISHV